jgi:hypothetical protein
MFHAGKEYRSNREGTYGRPSEAALMRMSVLVRPKKVNKITCVMIFSVVF